MRNSQKLQIRLSELSNGLGVDVVAVDDDGSTITILSQPLSSLVRNYVGAEIETDEPNADLLVAAIKDFQAAQDIVLS